MELVSGRFFLFAAIVAIVYYLFPVKKYQWTVLLAASWFYYIFNCNKYIVYILITTITTYFGAWVIDKIISDGKLILKENKQVWDKEAKKAFKLKLQKKKKFFLAVVLVLNFGILALVKYSAFASNAINSVLESFNCSFAMPAFKFIAPLGISFYTFQSMGYVIDVYRGKVTAERNFAKLALFVSFFPQIVQGPIGIYSNLAEQLYSEKKFKYENMKSGLLLIFWGMFKKLILADRAAIIYKYIVDDYKNFSRVFIIFSALIYAIQLYADFSGGIDVCRGIAEILGINMAENFKRPYFSKTLTEYWHRWHITLGEWLRNYLFYPISISKAFLKMGKFFKNHKMKHFGKVFPTALASLITFIIIGIWHGAEMKYVAFGIWNGMVIMLSSLMQPWFDKLTAKLKINKSNFFYGIFAMIRTFFFVLVGYYFDIAPSFGASINMLKSSVFNLNFENVHDDFVKLFSVVDSLYEYGIIIFACMVIFAISIIQEKSKKNVRDLLVKSNLAVEWLVYLALIISVAIFGYYGPGTAPSEFVYMQF